MLHEMFGNKMKDIFFSNYGSGFDIAVLTQQIMEKVASGKELPVCEKVINLRLLIISNSEFIKPSLEIVGG